MPFRNWLRHPPVGVGLGIVALLLFAGINNRLNHTDQRDHTDSQHQSAAAPPPSAVPQDQQPNASVHQDACDQAASKEQTDHCIQLRTLAIAEEQNRLAAWEPVWSGIEALLLFATLVATAVASIAAVRATRIAASAAKDSDKGIALAAQSAKASKASARASADMARVMDRQLMVLQSAERAYVHLARVSLLKPDLEKGERVHTIKFEVRNSGRTPAYELVFSAKYDVCEIPLQEPLGEGEGRPDSGPSTLAPGADTGFYQAILPIFTSRLDEIEAGKFAIYVWGKITHRDAFGRKWPSDYVMVYSGPDSKRTGLFANYMLGIPTA